MERGNRARPPEGTPAGGADPAMEDVMTPLTILIASLVILIVDYFAERYIRVRKRSQEEEQAETSTFDWLSNPISKH